MPTAVRSLLAAAAAVSLVAAAATAAGTGTEDPQDPDRYDPDRQYVTRLQQGPDYMFTTHGPAGMPHGLCARDIDHMLFCDNMVPPTGVSVKVEDYAPFPVIDISNDLKRAHVQRAEPCAGEAVLTVQLSCSFP